MYATHRRADTQPIRLEPHDRTVAIGDRVVRLSTLEFEVLRVLVENAPRCISYQELLTAVWGSHAAQKKNYLKLYVYYLRSKLEDGSSQPLIVNERQRGYRLAYSNHEDGV